MAYTLTLVPQDGEPLTPDRWCAAIKRAPHFRLTDQTALSVQAGENAISRPLTGFEAEWKAPDTGAWTLALLWNNGIVTTPAPRTFDNDDDPFRCDLTLLARDLDATITGEEGETYQEKRPAKAGLLSRIFGKR